MVVIVIDAVVVVVVVVREVRGCAERMNAQSSARE